MRMKRKAIAQDTVKILEVGYYESPSNKRVDIAKEMAICLARTKCYEPDFSASIQLEDSSVFKTEFEVRNETTLMGAERLAKSQKFARIGVLNFASAKKSWRRISRRISGSRRKLGAKFWTLFESVEVS